MPISPQIVITPEDIDTKNFDISAVSYTSTTATYTATGHTFSAGDVVLVSDLVPDGYNGTFTITSIATNTFTVDNTTNEAVTDPIGNAFWTDPEYEYEDLTAVFPTDNTDLSDPEINPAFAVADEAAAAAAAAQASASTAYDTAVAANTAASTAQSTANGKNKVTYSTTTPGTTANTSGDIWFVYGTTSPNVGRIIAQYMGNGGTSWTQTTVSGLVVANIDAGSITTGTLSVALGITGTAGNFSVDAVTGALVATKATITGAVNALSGYFGSSTNGYSVSSTGLVGVGSGTIATSSGSSAVVLDGSQNGIGIKYSGSYVGWISSIATAGIVINYGTTPDVGTYPQSRITSGAMTVSGTSSSGFSANSNGTNGITGTTTHYQAATFNSNLTVNNELYAAGHSTTTNAANGYVFTTGGRIARSTASSSRYKENIVDLVSINELDPKKLLQLPVRAFTYKDGYLKGADDRKDMLIPGFIAEEVDQIYPIAADYIDGPESWNDRIIIPALLALIQDQEKRIQILEGN